MKKISWRDIRECTNRLAVLIDKKGIKNIYGLPRGGLIPAVMLSHKLGKPLITDAKLIGPDTLIVDELTDTGKALPKLRKSHPFKMSAVLYHSPKSKFTPTYFARTKAPQWLKFPWE